MVRPPPKKGTWLTLEDINRLVTGCQAVDSGSELQELLLDEYGATKLPRLSLDSAQFLRSPWAWPIYVEVNGFSHTDVVNEFGLPGSLSRAFLQAAELLFVGEAKADLSRLLVLFGEMATQVIEWFETTAMEKELTELEGKGEEAAADVDKVPRTPRVITELQRRLRRKFLEARQLLREINASAMSKHSKTAGDAYLAASGPFATEDYDEKEASAVKKALYTFKPTGLPLAGEDSGRNLKRGRKDSLPERKEDAMKCRDCHATVSRNVDPHFAKHRLVCAKKR